MPRRTFADASSASIPSRRPRRVFRPSVDGSASPLEDRTLLSTAHAAIAHHAAVEHRLAAHHHLAAHHRLHVRAAVRAHHRGIAVMAHSALAMAHDPIVSVSPTGAVSVGGTYRFPAILTRASATGTTIPPTVVGLGTTGSVVGTTGTTVGATGRTYSTSGAVFTPSQPNYVAIGTGSGGSTIAGLSTLTPYSRLGTSIPTATIGSNGVPRIPAATIGQTGPLTTFVSPSYVPRAAIIGSSVPILASNAYANPYLTSAIGTAGAYPISTTADNLYANEFRSVNPYLASSTLANPYLSILGTASPAYASVAAADRYLATIDAMNPHVRTVSTYSPYAGTFASFNPYLTTSSLYSGLNMA